MNQLSFFDYRQLDAETQDYVRQRTDEIKALMRRSAQDIIEIGQKLIEVKARLGHGHFGNWLECEFAWSHMTATKFMNVAGKFKQSLNLELFAPSALYLLAAPSTPESAREEAIERAEEGEEITHQAAQEIVEKHKDEEAEQEEHQPEIPTELEDETGLTPEEKREDLFAQEPDGNGYEPQEKEIIPDYTLALDEDQQAIAEQELWEEEQIEMGSVKRGLWIDPFIAEPDVISEAIEYLNGYYVRKTGRAYIWREG
jgi:hypothetical protein